MELFYYNEHNCGLNKQDFTRLYCGTSKDFFLFQKNFKFYLIANNTCASFHLHDKTKIINSTKFKEVEYYSPTRLELDDIILKMNAARSVNTDVFCHEINYLYKKYNNDKLAVFTCHKPEYVAKKVLSKEYDLEYLESRKVIKSLNYNDQAHYFLLQDLDRLYEHNQFFVSNEPISFTKMNKLISHLNKKINEKQ